jgi:hypothetical protein
VIEDTIPQGALGAELKAQERPETLSIPHPPQKKRNFWPVQKLHVTHTNIKLWLLQGIKQI